MKKKIKMALIIVLSFLVINPINAKALENDKLLNCKYNYKNIELNYSINKNGVDLAFNDGDKLTDKTWFSSSDFASEFFASSKTSDGNYTCPTITIEENTDMINVFVNTADEKKYDSEITKLNTSNIESFNGTKVVDVIDTKISEGVGIYKKSSYFIPQYRKLSNGTIEWSINNGSFSNISKGIKVNNDTIKIDENLIKNLFTNNENKVKIYRCVFEEKGNLNYSLTTNKKYCKQDLSENDNQGEESISYNGAQGEEEESCQGTLLGDPNDEKEESVAWLLQKLLNYIKILAPMIILIMSAIDFSKALLAGDDDVMQKSYKRLINRLILAVVLFFVPDLVMLLLEVFGLSGESICGLQ